MCPEVGEGSATVFHGRSDPIIERALVDFPDWLPSAILARLDGYPQFGSCWIWPGATAKGNPQGRLPAGVLGRRSAGVSVRRVIWLALVGSIPPGEVVHVRCGNSLCCNPAHATVMTFWALVRDESMQSAPAVALRRVNCPRGHPLTPENNIPNLSMRGWRGCHQCLTDRNALVRQAVAVTGHTWRSYATEHGLSRAEALRIMSEAGIEPAA